MGDTEQAPARDGRITNDGLLKVRTGRKGEQWLVEVSGDLDLANVATLDAELQRLNGEPVQLDLTRLDFMDSSGITVLARAAMNKRYHDGELAVRPGTGQPARLLGLCGIDAKIQQLA